MLSKIRSYWQYGTTFCGVEVTSSLSEKIVFAVTAKMKNNEFQQLEFLQSDSLVDLSKKLSKNQHCYLTINTDKVLIKEVPFDINAAKVLSLAFPGLSLSEFYYEILNTESKCFVAVCRKDYVNSILDEVEKQKINVIGFNLGFTPLTKLIHFIDKNEIITSQYQFTIEDQSIFSFSDSGDTTESYNIDDIQMPSDYLMSVSSLFNYVSVSSEIKSNLEKENNKLKIGQQEKNFFNKGIKVALGIVFTLLLLNFLVFGSSFKDQQTLQEEVGLLEYQRTIFTTKLAEIDKKERMVNNILNSGNSKSSYYINRIAYGKSASIIFDQIQFQPLKKAIRPEKQIEYDQNEITIGGESSDKEAFSRWIESLEQFEWIKSVTVTGYGLSKRNTSSFDVELQLKQ
jgi:hypothetical protein